LANSKSHESIAEFTHKTRRPVFIGRQASYIFILARWKCEVNGWLVVLPEFSLPDKNWRYNLHKMRIAKGVGVWYIVITKKKEVSPKYYSD
jgi:hypothetical protein